MYVKKNYLSCNILFHEDLCTSNQISLKELFYTNNLSKNTICQIWIDNHPCTVTRVLLNVISIKPTMFSKYQVVAWRRDEQLMFQEKTFNAFISINVDKCNMKKKTSNVPTTSLWSKQNQF